MVRKRSPVQIRTVAPFHTTQTFPGGVTGNTPRSGRGESRFEPWLGSCAQAHHLVTSPARRGLSPTLGAPAVGDPGFHGTWGLRTRESSRMAVPHIRHAFRACQTYAGRGCHSFARPNLGRLRCQVAQLAELSVVTRAVGGSIPSLTAMSHVKHACRRRGRGTSCTGSSTGESSRLLIGRFWVRIPSGVLRTAIGWTPGWPGKVGRGAQRVGAASREGR